MTKVSIHQEEITIMNTHVPNFKAPEYTYKANIEGTEGRNRQQYNNNRILHYLTFNNEHLDIKSIRK